MKNRPIIKVVSEDQLYEIREQVMKSLYEDQRARFYFIDEEKRQDYENKIMAYFIYGYNDCFYPSNYLYKSKTEAIDFIKNKNKREYLIGTIIMLGNDPLHLFESADFFISTPDFNGTDNYYNTLLMVLRIFPMPLVADIIEGRPHLPKNPMLYVERLGEHEKVTITCRK